VNGFAGLGRVVGYFESQCKPTTQGIGVKIKALAQVQSRAPKPDRSPATSHLGDGLDGLYSAEQTTL
jgi:hypothetical protein